MRQSGLPYAIATFAIPPHPPEPVARAAEEFNDVASRWAEARGDLQDAEEALTQAKQADIRAVVDAAAEGKDVKHPQANQLEVETRIADLRVRLRGLDVATDEAGDRLARTIATHREEWLLNLRDAEVQAAARFDEALTEARAAITELRPARGAVTWLDSFDEGLAQGGQQAQFSGGRLRVKGRLGTARGEFDPAALLDLAAQVTEAPAKVVAHA